METRSMSPWKFVRQELFQQGRWLLPCVMMFFAFSATAIYLLPQYLLQGMIDAFGRGNPSDVCSRIAPFILKIGGAYLLGATCWRIFQWIAAVHGNRLVCAIRRDILDHLDHMPFSFFSSRYQGALAQDIDVTVSACYGLAIELPTSLIESLTLMSGSTLILMTAHWWLGTYFSAWLLVFLAVTIYGSHVTSRKTELGVRAKNDAFGGIGDKIGNIATVMGYAAFEKERTRIDDLQRNEYRAVRQADISINLMVACQWVLFIGLHVGMYVILGMLYRTGTLAIDLGQIAMLIAVVSKAHWELWDISGHVRNATRSYGQLSEGLHVVYNAPSIDDGTVELDLSLGDRSIRIENLSFGYASRTALFQGLSFTIPSGQRVGIVGRSGVGKTTLVSLLHRFNEPPWGTIFIGSQDVRSLRIASLRHQMTVISQETSLFHRSIRDNICYGAINVTAEQLERAMRIADCDFVAYLPQGLETIVGERGIKLSGGQRQRIALARAILADAPIMILDEATSALDNESERAIQHALDELMRGRTTLAIAHRLSTIRRCDRILVLEENGHGVHIAEDGLPQDLERSGGSFADMIHRAHGDFLPEDSQ